MFKNMIKRSWLSVTRKLSRTVILALVLFAMANLVLAGIAIRGAVDESMQYAKNKLGSEVTLSPDMEKIRDNMRSQAQDSTTTTQETVRKMVRPSVPKNTADEIATSDFLRDYTYSLIASANLPDDLSAVESSNDPIGRGGDAMSVGGDRAGETAGDVRVNGVNSYAYISEVKNSEMTISDGQYFDESSTDGVMISVDFAELNSLKVGDHMTLTKTSGDTKIDLNIIGIYDTTSDQHNANTIYANVDVAAKFLDETSYSGGNYGVNNVTYYMNNPDDAEAFVSEMNAKYPELAANNLTLGVNDDAYQQMVGPIESVGGFATTILWVVVIASVCIVALIVTINIKDRRYEMGVLMSLGASRGNIVGQILVELTLVGTLAFGLSAATGNLLAGAMGNELLSSQISANQQESEQNFGRPTAMGGARPSGSGAVMGGPAMRSNVDAIDELDISASPTDYVLLFTIGYAAILVALIIPSVNILRFEPKAILTGKE